MVARTPPVVSRKPKATPGIPVGDLRAASRTTEAVFIAGIVPWGLDLYERTVLRIICDHAFNGPWSKPSQKLIAQEATAMGVPMYRERANITCRHLREKGVISVHKERAPGARWDHNVYAIHSNWTRPNRRLVLSRLDVIRGRGVPAQISVSH